MTAAVARALTDAGISANVVAGFHHDHLFVARERAQEAVDVLRSMARPSWSPRRAVIVSLDQCFHVEKL